MTIFEGSAVAIVTPFIENTTEIDYRAFEDLLDFHLAHHTDAIVVAGTTGEGSTLTDEEQIQLIKFAVDHIDHRIPVIAGTGINDTFHSIKLSTQAEEVGADALLVVTPYYNQTSYNGMLVHFKTIADAVNIPIILYHVPGRTAMTFSPEQIAELATHPNIVALKDAAGDLEFTKAVLDIVPEDFAVYSGNDDLNHEITKLGGKGAISVTANVMPEEIHQVIQLNLEGKVLEAEQLNAELARINTDLFVETNPIPVKYLSHRLGWNSLTYRLPLVPPAKEAQEKLDVFFDELSEKYHK